MRSSVLFRVVRGLDPVFALLLFVSLLTIPLSANADVQTAASGKGPGSITVRIKPPAAREAGARWRVDGGVWLLPGGTLTGLWPGDHTVSFKNIYGWQAPQPRQVSIEADQERVVTVQYRLDTLQIDLPGDVPLIMTWIPQGSFMMGRNPNEGSSSYQEDPQHLVTLAYGFWMSKYEVTKAQWEAVMNTTPWTGELHVLDDPDSPAVFVSWGNAQAFMGELNRYVTDTGQGPAAFRLPSEAEWEYACRAGTMTRYYWGNDPNNLKIFDYAWSKPNTDYAHIVGLKRPNAFGLYDMSGNVKEWCKDWFHGGYFDPPTDGSAWTERPQLENRVLRGGGWSDYMWDCRSASRFALNPSSHGDSTGFRVARSR